MSTATATLTMTGRRELAQRVSSDLEVTLYWDASDDSTSVEVHHFLTGETIAFVVRPEWALDAFYHPFAHLALASGSELPEEGSKLSPWN
jgi:hypothetical protein